MAWWNAKYKNDHGEYEITFGSNDYEKTKAVEKVCQSVIDKKITCKEDVECVVRCNACVNYNTDNCSSGFGWCENLGIGVHDDFFCKCGERKEGAD